MGRTRSEVGTSDSEEDGEYLAAEALEKCRREGLEVPFQGPG
jgi:hypothetical protein